MSFLSVSHLKKVYGKASNQKVAINDISFSIEKGEFVMIVGASGSGKSTLMHILGGVDVPTQGTLTLNGKDVFSQSQEELAAYRRKSVSIIYQSYNLIPLLTVQENIYFPTMLDNKDIHHKKLSLIAKQLKIDDILNRFPNQLSGGQQQRVSIARSLYLQPEILLADEPTGNLDVANSNEVMRILKQAHDVLHQTIIMITHNMDLIQFANRVITLQDGLIVNDEVMA